MSIDNNDVVLPEVDRRPYYQQCKDKIERLIYKLIHMINEEEYMVKKVGKNSFSFYKLMQEPVLVVKFISNKRGSFGIQFNEVRINIEGKSHSLSFCGYQKQYDELIDTIFDAIEYSNVSKPHFIASHLFDKLESL